MMELTIWTYFIAEDIGHGIKILFMILCFVAIFDVKHYFQIIGVDLLRENKLKSYNCEQCQAHGCAAGL